MKTFLHVLTLVVLFSSLTPTVSKGQDNSIGLDAYQQLPISLTIETQLDDGTIVPHEITLFVDLNLADALQRAGGTPAQIEAIVLNPTVSVEAVLGVAASDVAVSDVGVEGIEVEAKVGPLTARQTPETVSPQLSTGLDTVAPLRAVTVVATNLYSGPGEHFGAAAGAFAGDTLYITRRTVGGDWYQLDNGFWVAADMVTVAGQLGVVPETEMALTVSAEQQPNPTVTLESLSTPALPDEAPPTVVSAPTANRESNVRSGPGANYPVAGIVKAGQVLTITGGDRTGDWYQLADGTWISAFLVDNAPTRVKVIDAPPPPYPTEPLPTS